MRFNNPPVKPYDLKPIDGKKDVFIYLTLEWNSYDKDGDDIYYSIYLGENKDNLKLLKSNIKDNKYYVGPLDYSKKYYWKIKAVDSKGGYSYSDIQSFITINNSAPRIENIYIDSLINVELNPQISWEATDNEGDQILYNIYLNNELKVENYEKTTYKLINLNPGKTYKLKIEAVDDYGGKSDKIIEFKTTEAPKIIYMSPRNDTITLNGEMKLSWEATDFNNDEILYDVYIEKIDIDGEKVNPSRKIFENIKENEVKIFLNEVGKYYWKVIVKDERGAINESEVRNFVYKKNNIPEVNIIYPEDNSVLNNKNVSLAWEGFDKDGDKLIYNVYLDKNIIPTTIIATKINNNILEFSLKETGKYYWRVEVIDENKEKSFSNIYKFIFNNIPTEIELKEPKEGEYITGTKVKLSWEATDVDGDKLMYDIYFGKEPFPSLYKENYEGNYIYIENIESNKTYYWKIIAKDGKGEKLESSIMIFKTNTAPTEIELKEPKEGEYITGTKVKLSWEATDVDGDKLMYDIYFGKEPFPSLYKENYEGNYIYIENIESNKTYYWKIIAKDGKGEKLESSIMIFKTNTAPTEIELKEPKEGEYITGTKVKLSWEATDVDGDKLMYDICFGKEPNPALYKKDYESNYIYIENIESNKTYYWKIIAKDGKGGKLESSIMSFNTNTAPTNIYTQFDATRITLEPTIIINWSAIDIDGDKIKYDVYFGESEIPQLYLENIEFDNLELSNLKIKTTYYWKIVAKDGKGGISEGPIWSFTTNSKPEIINVYPKDNSFVQGNRPEYLWGDLPKTSVKLTWEATDIDNDEIYYDVYFNGELYKENIKDNYIILDELSHNIEYNWKLIVKDQYGAITESSIQKFVINTPPMLGQIYPKNNDILYQNEITLYYYAYDSDNYNSYMKYYIYFSEDSSPNIYKEDNKGGNIKISNLKENTDYYYRVIVEDDRGGKDDTGIMKIKIGENKIKNKISVSYQISSKVIVTDSNIYFSSNTNNSNIFYSLDNFGNFKWSKYLNGYVYDMLIDDTNDKIFVYTYDYSSGGKIYALSTLDGKISWEYSLGESGYYSSKKLKLNKNDSILYISGRYSIYALDISNGTKKWSFKTSSEIRNEFYIDEINDLLIFTTSYYLYALNLSDGSAVWNIYTGSSNSINGIFVENSKIYYTIGKYLYIADSANGNILLQKDINSYGGKMIIIDDYIYVSGYSDQNSCSSRKLLILNKEGEKINETSWISTSEPIYVSEDLLLINGYDSNTFYYEMEGMGYIYAITKEGNIIWKIFTGNYICFGNNTLNNYLNNYYFIDGKDIYILDFQ
jgi:hypothetical protein